MALEIPQKRRSEIQRIIAREQRFLRMGLPPGVRIQKIPPLVSGLPPGEPVTDPRVVRSTRRERPKRKAGPAVLQLARELRAQGYTVSQVARDVGVSKTSVRDWQAKGWLGR